MGIKEYKNMSEIMKGVPDAKRDESTQSVRGSEEEGKDKSKRSEDIPKRDG